MRLQICGMQQSYPLRPRGLHWTAFVHLQCADPSMDPHGHSHTFILFLCFLITNDALENNLSAGTEVAGIERKSRAIFDKIGYSVSCVLHQSKMSSELAVLGFLRYSSNSSITKP
ncbi:unnamed protein product [Leptosia nina]|uniref:Uncharacterized protein n=1 Tax=Leptosia nina TaxID=320188 RepID=A0AAV1K1F1_9NEOP